MEPDEIESRLNAHRNLLVEILSEILGREDSKERMRMALEGDSPVQDQEEDPGVVEPSDAFAIEAGTRAEIRAIIGEAFERLAAMERR